MNYREISRIAHPDISREVQRTGTMCIPAAEVVRRRDLRAISCGSSSRTPPGPDLVVGASVLEVERALATYGTVG